MRIKLVLCAVVALLCGAQAKEEKNMMPQIEVNCPPGGIAEQKAQNLLNQDLQTLRNYFDEKCAMVSSMCKDMTVQQAEQKICELRSIRTRLFPQGTNSAAQPITTFDCNKYTPGEKKGCPSPMSATPTVYTGASPVWPFTDTVGSNTQPGTGAGTQQTPRNNWDVVIDEKVNEYKDKMQAYRNMMGINRPNPYGGATYSGYQGSATSAYSQSIPNNFVSFQPTVQAASMSTASTFGPYLGGLQTFAKQQLQPSGWAFNSNSQPGNYLFPFNSQAGQSTVTANNQYSNNNQYGTTNPYATGTNSIYGSTNPYASSTTNQFGSANQYTSTNSNQYGSTATNNNQYGSTATNNNQYGSTATNNNQYGSTTTNNNQYGSTNPYSTTTNTFGSGSTNQQSGTYSQYSGGTSSSYGGFGMFGSGLGNELYKQAMELRRCLPPGSIKDDIYGGQYYPMFGEPEVPDPLLVLCRVRDNPKYFTKLESKIVKQFTENIEGQCGSFTTEISQMVDRVLRATDPMAFIQQEMSLPNTLQQMVVRKCATKEIYNKLKQKDVTTMNSLNCNNYQTQIESFKTEAEVKMKLKKMEDDPFPLIQNPYGEKADPMKKLIKSLYCERSATRDLIYQKLGNMKLAICLMNEKMKGKSMSYRDFKEMFEGYLKIAKKIYYINQVPENPPINDDAQRILANLYRELNLQQLGLSSDSQPLTQAAMTSQIRSKLTISNAVFGQQNLQSCNTYFQNSQPARNFQITVASAVADCQRGNKDAMENLHDKAKEIAMQLTESNLDNNRIKLCLAYTMATALPDSSSSLAADFERLMFAKKLFKIVDKEVERASYSATSVGGNCEGQMTPQAQQSLSRMLTKFSSGELMGLKEETYAMFNPADVTAPLTEADKKRYKACKNRKVFDLSNSQMCQAFANVMNTITQDISRRMTEYRNGAAIDIKKEIALIMMTPTNPSVVTPSTQLLGSCTGNRQVTPQGIINCPSGITCCSNPQAVCENNQCRITNWQESFCKMAAAARGKSASDPYTYFMETMLKDGGKLEKQEMYSYYMKYARNSVDCQNVFGTRNSNSNTQANTGSNTQYSAVWPFTNNGASSSYSSSTSSGSSVPWPFNNNNIGGQVLGSSNAGYSSALNILQTSGYSMGFSPYPDMSGPQCPNPEGKKKFICAWHMVYDAFKSTACPNRKKQNPLFPDYDFDPFDFQRQQCAQDQFGYGQYPGAYGLEQKNKDCEVYTEAQEKSAKTGYDTGFIVMMKYRDERFGGYGGYGGIPAYRAGGGDDDDSYGAFGYYNQASPQTPASSSGSVDGLSYF